MMCQKCYGFYWNIKKWLKLDQNADSFGSLQEFFVYTLLHSVSYAQRFCQMKDLIQIYVCDKFL